MKEKQKLVDLNRERSETRVFGKEIWCIFFNEKLYYFADLSPTMFLLKGFNINQEADLPGMIPTVSFSSLVKM